MALLLRCWLCLCAGSVGLSMDTGPAPGRVVVHGQESSRATESLGSSTCVDQGISMSLACVLSQRPRGEEDSPTLESDAQRLSRWAALAYVDLHAIDAACNCKCTAWRPPAGAILAAADIDRRGFQASQGASRGTARGLRGLRGAGCTVEDSAGISEPGGPTRWLWGCLADWCERRRQLRFRISKIDPDLCRRDVPTVGDVDNQWCCRGAPA